MSYFEENPTFWAELDRAIANALEKKAADVRDLAKGLTSHSSVARKITARPVKVDASGPYATVTTGGGLGNIFEPGTRQRQTRTGANRGAVRGEHFLERAMESEALWGLDIRI